MSRELLSCSTTWPEFPGVEALCLAVAYEAAVRGERELAADCVFRAFGVPRAEGGAS